MSKNNTSAQKETPTIEKQYVFYKSERKATSLPMHHKNFFLLFTPTLGDVNFDAFSRMSDVQKWELLVGCFETMTDVIQNLDVRVRSLEESKGKKNANKGS